VIRAAVRIWGLDRVLLVSYLIALSAILMFPISGQYFRFLGIQADKWMHVALFGGLAVFLRWNLSASRHAVILAIGAASAFAGATEAAQSLVPDRSAELWDFLAGVLGASIGAAGMNRIVSSPVPEKLAGLVIAAMGLMLGALFVLADVVIVGTSGLFGPVQMAGAALSALITVGGIGIYLTGLRRESGPTSRDDR